jgi:hypothetical protein
MLIINNMIIRKTKFIFFVFINVKNLYFSLNEINNIVCRFEITLKQDFQQLIKFHFLKHHFHFVYFDKNVNFYFT